VVAMGVLSSSRAAGPSSEMATGRERSIGADADSPEAAAGLRISYVGEGGTPETYAIDDNLGYLVNRMARLVSHMFSRRLKAHGVQLGQWAILEFLYARDGLSQAQLSRLVAIEPPTIVRTIDRMERDGLVRREPHPEDGRAVRIRLLPRAIALRDALVAESIAGNEFSARMLSREELETLKSLLRRVIIGLAHSDDAKTGAHTTRRRRRRVGVNADREAPSSGR